MKTCKLCQQEYQPTPSEAKRGAKTCAPCHAAAQRDRRARAIAAGQPLDRQPRNREAARRQYLKERAQPEIRARLDARSNARRAIREGRLTRLNCEVCGGAPTEAHHDDYSRPLDVRWLCPTHHRAHHATARPSTVDA